MIHYSLNIIQITIDVYSLTSQLMIVLFIHLSNTLLLDSEKHL